MSIDIEEECFAIFDQKMARVFGVQRYTKAYLLHNTD